MQPELAGTRPALHSATPRKGIQVSVQQNDPDGMPSNTTGHPMYYYSPSTHPRCSCVTARLVTMRARARGQKPLLPLQHSISAAAGVTFRLHFTRQSRSPPETKPGWQGRRVCPRHCRSLLRSLPAPCAAHTAPRQSQMTWCSRGLLGARHLAACLHPAGAAARALLSVQPGCSSEAAGAAGTAGGSMGREGMGMGTGPAAVVAGGVGAAAAMAWQVGGRRRCPCLVAPGPA